MDKCQSKYLFISLTTSEGGKFKREAVVKVVVNQSTTHCQFRYKAKVVDRSFETTELGIVQPLFSPTLFCGAHNRAYKIGAMATVVQH